MTRARVVSLVSLAATALVAVWAAAFPSPQVVNSVKGSVFKVSCSGKSGTGFAARVDDKELLVTALHVVSGCSRVLIHSNGGAEFDSAIMRVHRHHDLAELKWPKSLKLKALGINRQLQPPGAQLSVLGAGLTPTIQSKQIKIRATANSTDTVATLVDQARLLLQLKKLGFPGVDAAIVNTEGDFFPGDSGGPVFDSKGEVVGVANGGLLKGQIPITWAIPAQGIYALAVSTDTNHAPGSSSGASVLLHARGGGPASSTRSRRTVICAGAEFGYVADASLRQVLASADQLSRSQAQLALTYANGTGNRISNHQQFAIYLHSASGATFAVPGEMAPAQAPRASDCKFAMPGSPIDMHVTLQRTTAPLLPSQQAWQRFQVPSGLFEYRLLPAGMVGQTNPALSMIHPISRQDGMYVRRATYGIYSPVGSFGEIVVSHASKNDYYLGVAMRSNSAQPGMALTGFYPAVVATFIAAFTFG